MNHSLQVYTLSILLIAISSISFAGAQTGADATEHFEQDGLAFDYPFDWAVKDSSSPGMQKLTITPKGTEAQIVVNVERTLGRSCDFPLETRNIIGELVEKTAAQINAVSPVTSYLVRTQVGAVTAEGAQLQGAVNGKRVTAEVYSLRLYQHFVSLIYIRNEADRRSFKAWEIIRRSLRISQAVMTYGRAPPDESIGASEPHSLSSGNFLNGRAVALPKPAYPPIARSAHASGTVAVQVVIDETGNVISAHAVSGHPLLMSVSVAAAKEAKFTPPKFCGEPLRVTGVITYNFVAQ